MSDLPTPGSRVERLLANLDGVQMSIHLPPTSNVEKYLAYICGVSGVELPDKPESNVEAYLEYMALHPAPTPPIPIYIDKNITANGEYNAEDDNADGYKKVTVTVPTPILDELVATVNGEYNPTHDGYSKVTVQVPDPALETLSATQNGEYTPTAYGYSRVTVNVPLPSNAYLLKTVSGLPASIASFTASDAPLDSLKVGVEAVQDLHGYDKPWAGGAGKNKLPLVLADIKGANTSGTWSGNAYTVNSVTFTVNTDADGNIASISTSGTASAESVLNLTSESYHTLDYYGIPTSGSLFLSGCPSGSSTFKYTIQMQSGNSANIQDTGNGAELIANATSTYYFRIVIANGQASAGLVFYPMIRLSTESATFAPYSNICPISGWSEAVVTDRGINIWDEEWEVGDINGASGINVESLSHIRTKNYVSVNPNTSYYFSCANEIRIRYYDKDKLFIGEVDASNKGKVTPTGNIRTTQSNCYYIRFVIRDTTTYANNVSVNYPSTDTSYHAYNGKTVTIQFGSTIYDGELDVVNGTSGNKLTHGIRQGFTRGTLDSSGKLYKLTPTLDDVAVWTDTSMASPKIMSNMFKVMSLGDARTATTPSLSQYNTSFYVGGYVGDEATLDALLSNLQIKYELATPTTFETQPTSIKSLNGSNNIFADCGDINEVKCFEKEV